MDYFKDAFGGFDPQRDDDAALKFILDSLIADERLNDLIALMSADNEVGGLEGEPGWIMEKRDNGPVSGFEDWPLGARYRSYVDPNSYQLAYPEFFCDRAMFNKYVEKIASAVEARHPEQSSIINEIRRLFV